LLSRHALMAPPKPVPTMIASYLSLMPASSGAS
jgi:hypothetical protein